MRGQWEKYQQPRRRYQYGGRDVNEAAPIPANINTQAYETIKQSWIDRAMWNRKWGIMPGFSWKHHDPLVEDSPDVASPVIYRPFDPNKLISDATTPSPVSVTRSDFNDRYREVDLRNPARIGDSPFYGTSLPIESPPGPLIASSISDGAQQGRSSDTTNTSSQEGSANEGDDDFPQQSGSARERNINSNGRQSRAMVRKSSSPGPWMKATKVSKRNKSGPRSQPRNASGVRNSTVSSRAPDPNIAPSSSSTAANNIPPRRSKRLHPQTPSVAQDSHTITSPNPPPPPPPPATSTSRSRPKQPTVATKTKSKSSAKPEGISKAKPRSSRTTRKTPKG